jgi:hypothetical protein
MIPKTSDVNKRHCTVLWVIGAQKTMIIDHYPRKAGFKGQVASLQKYWVGSDGKKKSPNGVDKITGDAVSTDISKANETFPLVAKKLETPHCPRI